MRQFAAGAFLGLCLSISAAHAIDPREALPDPAQEQRARDIGRELRCLVCQNESIDTSDADLAKDIRHLIRERIAAGQSDGEIVGYLRSRYGDFILLDPPLNERTALLWVAPGLALAAGGSLAAWHYAPLGRARRRQARRRR